MTEQPPPSASQRAETWLRQYLPADGTPVPSQAAQTAAAAENSPISARTLQRAARSLGVCVTQAPGPRGRISLWALPASPAPAAVAPTEPQPTDQAAPATRHGQLGRNAEALLMRGRWDRRPR